MCRLLLLIAFPTVVTAQAMPPLPNLDAARAAARQVDQAAQAPRIGKESMDRVTPLLTVEPHDAPDDGAPRKAKEDPPKTTSDASEPK